MNIDVKDLQNFDVDYMLEQAEKLGMDFGDIQEFGLDLKSAKCGGKTCFNKDKFKSYDEILNKGGLFGIKFGDESAKLLKSL